MVLWAVDFLAIVQVYWADIIVSNAMMLSIFKQNIKNNVHNVAISPGLSFGLHTCVAVHWHLTLATEWWIPAFPFSLLIWVADKNKIF